MKPFLKELAEEIFEKHGGQLDDLTIVFPNRRAGLFFRKYLAESIAQPVWSPNILSLEDFVRNLTTLQSLDKLSLIFKLYESYKKHNKAEEGFDRFFYWGEMLLKDFDELDRYLIDAQNLFTNLLRQKELDATFDFLTDAQKKIILDFWSNFDPNDSKEKRNFIKIWDILFKVYDSFTENLKANNQAYLGMMYREVAEKMEADELLIENQKVLFAGFNALTPSEEKIITWFVKNRSSEIFWDVDAYYFNNSIQEAGMFLRAYKEKAIFERSFEKEVPRNLEANEKTIKIIGISSKIGQARTLSQQVAEVLKIGASPEKTVVVLPDENLLFPVLNALPEAVDKVNVTMGYPLRNTPLYNLFEYLIEMQLKLRLSKDKKLSFPHRQVLAVLKHPSIINYNRVLATKNIKHIERNNRIFVADEELEKDESLYPLIFRKVEAAGDIFDYLNDMLLQVVQNGEEDKNTLEQEYAFHFYTQLNRFKEIVKEQNITLKLEVFLKLFRQIIQSIKIPFTGEPLNGLQIMGVLETRNLDFDNVFILSMNEGLFPAQGNLHSFIPYNIRKAYSLPTYDHQDAIYAYLFYRILQRAKNIQIFYNTESEALGGGEMSRYLQQLIYESDLNIEKVILSQEIETVEVKEIAILKNAKVMAGLDKYIVGKTVENKRLAPSALTTYLDCRLKFYFKYIANIKEPEALEEEVDAKVFGNILHEALEALYQNHIEKNKTNVVKEADFKSLISGLEDCIDAAFGKHFGTPQGKKYKYEGRNVIVKEIIKKFTKKVLALDKSYAPFEVLGLEMGEADGIVLDLNIKAGQRDITVGLKGIIDRVDRKENVVRVIDYKTGKDETTFSTVADLFDRSLDKRNKVAMQTLFYSLLYQNKHSSKAAVMTPAVFNSKEMFGEKFDYRLKYKEQRKSIVLFDAKPFLEEYKGHLKALLEELFDVEVPFDQTDDVTKCGYCAYKDICRR